MSDDRLTGLDASFLPVEDGSVHMHVASVLIFEGTGAVGAKALTELATSPRRRS